MTNTAQRRDPAVGDLLIKQLIIVYILLLLLEGTLRKWFLPSFSNYLVLIRDPVVLLAYACAFFNSRLPLNPYIVSLSVIAFVAVVATIAFGHNSPIVLYYGFKSNFLHIPFAFLIGRMLYRQDVISIGKWWLWISLGMTAIIILQFYQPQSAWINRAPGGVEGGGFSGAMGRYRPPGTFSFIVGVVWFYTFATAFLVAGLTQHRQYNKLLLSLSAFAICLSIPISISRSLILSVGLTVMIGIVIVGLQKHMMLRLARIGAILCIGLVIASTLPVFDDAKEVFVKRWEQSTRQSQGGVQTMIVWRIANEFLGPFMQLDKMPVVGAGIGAGTMVGAQYLTGKRKFYLGEGDWFRIMEESGILIGTAFIFWRIALAYHLLKLSLRTLRFTGNGLTILIFSATMFNLLVGQLGQATINGFTILGVGLTIASMRTPPEQKPPSTQVEDSERPSTAPSSA